jgi:hypothetical protein
MSDKAIIELFIRVDGSFNENRLCTFELPVTYHPTEEEGVGAIHFESKDLVKSIKKAVDKLL